MTVRAARIDVADVAPSRRGAEISVDVRLPGAVVGRDALQPRRFERVERAPFFGELCERRSPIEHEHMFDSTARV